MNQAEFKDLVSHMCLAGALIACSVSHKRWLCIRFESFYCNQIFLSLKSANSLKTFKKNSIVSEKFQKYLILIFIYIPHEATQCESAASINVQKRQSMTNLKLVFQCQNISNLQFIHIGKLIDRKLLTKRKVLCHICKYVFVNLTKLIYEIIKCL